MPALELEAGEVVGGQPGWPALRLPGRACTGWSRRSPNGPARARLWRPTSGRRSSRTGRSPGSSGSNGLRLAPSQQGAVRRSRFAPRPGRHHRRSRGRQTTWLNAHLQGSRRAQVGVALCAPTGRAAKRSSRLRVSRRRPYTGCWKPKSSAAAAFAWTPERPLACDLLVIDEASMIDAPLMRARRGRCRTNRHSW